MLFSKNGGLAPVVEKCEFPRENSTRYGFHPRKRPGFSLKRSQTMSKTSETMRVQAETAHKAPKVRLVRTRSVPTVTPADGCPRPRGPKREAGVNPAQGRCCDRPGGFKTPLRMTAGRRTPPRRAESQKTCPSGSVHVRGLGPRPRAGRSLSRCACSRRPVPNLAPPRTSPARCRREEPSPCAPVPPSL
jgi:hypothetical protein